MHTIHDTAIIGLWLELSIHTQTLSEFEIEE